MPLDKNVVNLVEGTDFTQLQGMTGMYQQQCPPTSSSPTVSGTVLNRVFYIFYELPFIINPIKQSLMHLFL